MGFPAGTLTFAIRADVTLRRSEQFEKMSEELDVDGLTVTYSSGREGPPDLRLLHYNDVYHVE